MLTEFKDYGAVAAKVRAMFGRRLRAEDYLKLVSMRSTSQIAAFLKQHPNWSEVLRDKNVSDIHRVRLESILNTALYEDYQKILHFIPNNRRKLMEYPLLEAEIGQVLFFIRHLNSGLRETYHPNLPESLIPKLNFDPFSLAHAKSYAQMLEVVKGAGFAGILERFRPKEDQAADYNAIGLALDAYYFNYKLRSIAETSLRGRELKLKNIVGGQADVLNIMRTLRLRRYYPDAADELFSSLIPVFYKVKPGFLFELAKAPNDDTARQMLSGTPYGRLFYGGEHQYVEQYYDEYLSRFYRKLIYSSPPNILVPVAYLIVKQLEVRNVIHVIECVHYGLPTDRILSYIVGESRLKTGKE